MKGWTIRPPIAEGGSPTLLENEFVSVRALPGGSVIAVVRSGRRAESLDDIDASWGSVQRALAPLIRSRHTLLLDMREARGRNDPEFEAAVARHRARMLEGFPRVAVVVRTITGQMQIQRHMAEDRLSHVRVFDDYPRALGWLSEGAG